MITIKNEHLTVQIDPQGATLQSVFGNQTGIEYLWQGDRAYWGGRAPNLFPFVGRLFEGRYIYEGQSYPMKIHGFYGKMLTEPQQTAPDRCAFYLKDTPETYEVYPFHFESWMEYALEGACLKITFRVKNNGENTMYCGLGGHPGINIPMEEGLAFEDYDLVFQDAENARVVNFSQGVLTVSESPYALVDGCKLPLRHDLFCHDAVVLTNLARQVTIQSSKGSHGVTVAYPQMPYAGFWHKPNCDAPYVCVEPWSVLPGREGVVEELSTMPGMTAVAPGETWVNPWSIEIF